MFTDLISQFAHQIGQKRKGREVSSSLLKQFSEKNNDFTRVKSKPEVSEGFRFCEMALWGGLSERLQSPACKFLDAFGDTVQGVKQGIEGAANLLKNPIGGIGSSGSKQSAKPNNPIGGFLANRMGGGVDEDEEEEMMQPVKKINSRPKNIFGRSMFG